MTRGARRSPGMPTCAPAPRRASRRGPAAPPRAPNQETLPPIRCPIRDGRRGEPGVVRRGLLRSDASRSPPPSLGRRGTIADSSARAPGSGSTTLGPLLRSKAPANRPGGRPKIRQG